MSHLSEFQKQYILRLSRAIVGSYSHSGGDFPVHELFDEQVKKHDLSRDEAGYLDVLLIKAVSDYYGRDRV